MNRRAVRAIHTSDVHLGYEFVRGRAEEGLAAVVDTALSIQADLLLLPGDVFDHARVPDSLVEVLIAELTRFGKPTVILPGNHDALDTESVYLRPVFATRPSYVYLLTGDSIWIDELDMEVWGRPITAHVPEFRPLADAPERVRDGWRVILCHGHFEESGKLSGRSSPVLPEDIAILDADYVAFGHWDRQLDISQNGVTAWYSGAPHAWGSVADMLRIDFGDGVTVQPIPIVRASQPQ